MITLQKISRKLPIDISYGTIFDIHSNEITRSTHGFHKYPAKFIPLIPEWATRKYTTNDPNKTILDPFCGSGTSLVEGLLNNNNVIGMDIDPLSVLISKVKITPIDYPKLKKVAKWIEIELTSPIKLNFWPACKTLDHWFTNDASQKLAALRTLINKVPDVFGNEKRILDIQDLLLICFSSIIRRVSNADNQSQKTYVSHTLIKEPEEVFKTFLESLDYFSKRIHSFSTTVDQDLKRIVMCDSSYNDFTALLPINKVDLIITSPPYIKAIDYIYNQMVELFWIGDLFGLDTQPKQNSKKIEYIGNKQIPKSQYESFAVEKMGNLYDLLKTPISEIVNKDLKNGQKHSYIIFKYFSDLNQHLQFAHHAMRKGSHYIMVIGNSSVSGISIDSASIIRQIAEKNGFILENLWGYKIKNRFMRFDRKGRGGIIETDWVLDFTKYT